MTSEDRSKLLLKKIKDLILQKGPMPFYDFMQQALYAKDLGYYSHKDMKIGNDFITAPELGDWLAKVIAHLWQQMTGSIVEYGPGSGKLCYDILTACEKNKTFIKNYYLIEISDSLKYQQQKLINKLPSSLSKKVIWCDKCPKVEGLIIANEYFDAWPIEQFQIESNKIYQRCIALDTNDNICWHLKLLQEGSNFYTRVKNLNIKAPETYYSEIQLNWNLWWQSLKLTKGAIIAIDYGMIKEHYYSPMRNKGTLRCHYQHKAHNNPLTHIGLQDITAQVDFSALAHGAKNTDWKIAGFCKQNQFLLQHGLEEILLREESSLTQKDHYHLKQLLMPNEMGESFKVLGASLNIELDWFNQHNKVLSLFN